jgi:hypothetical protein
MTKQFYEEYTLSRTNILDQEDSISLERRFYMENLESLFQNSEMTSSNNQAREQDGHLSNENDDERVDQPQPPDQNRTPRILSTNLNQNQTSTHSLENHETTRNTTKKKKYNSKHEDNIRAQCVSTEMNKMTEILNQYCKESNLIEEFDEPNTGIQFRGSVKTYQNFKNAKIYQIYCYEKPGNASIIIRMIKEKKNEFFWKLVNYSFEDIHKIYTNDKSDSIIVLIERENEIESFLISKGFNYEKCINEKIDKMKKANKKSKEQIEKKRKNLIEYTMDLIKDINGEGKLTPRPNRYRPESKVIHYNTIEEIENFIKK